MKCALLFPPQWDPRHPHLSIPTLAGVLKAKGHEVKAWDANLYLYYQLLISKMADHKTAAIIKHYLQKDSLTDARQYARLSSALEYAIYGEYDATERHRLYWDGMDTPYSGDKSEDWKIAIKDPHKFPFFQKIKPHISEIVQWAPDFLFISCISDTQIFSTLAIASFLRARLKNVKIVLGGHAFIQRKSLLQHQAWLFTAVDAICVANGEPTVIALAAGKPFCEVPNIIWCSNGIIQTSKNNESVDFDASYKADFSVLPLSYYLSPSIVIPVETARGCPWGKCSFCNHPQEDTGLKWKGNQRIRQVEAVCSEIRQHIALGYTKFFFVDEALSYHRFRSLSNELSGVQDAISWICYLRLEEQHNFDTFCLAREAGCRKIFFGLETGSARLLELYRKGTTPQIAKRVIIEASKAGIAVHLFIITGFPDESDSDRAANEALLKEILPFINAFGFTYDIFPLSVALDTPLYKDPESYGASFTRKSKDDLACRFTLKFSKKARREQSDYHERIKMLMDNQLKNQECIVNLRFSHDSTHLLLIDSQLPGMLNDTETARTG